MDFSRFKNVKQVKSKIHIHRERAVGIVLTALFDKTKYEHGFYVKKDDKEYKVDIREQDLSKYDNLFSTPENDRYKKWCIHKTNKIISPNDLDVTIKYWSVIKPTMKIRGNIVGDVFVLNHSWINDKVNEEYDRYVAQDANKKN